MIDVKNERIKISIIVPFYNAERYLAVAVDSLLHQTLDSIEIIVVNDGSTDSSGKIADEYASRYKNITVLHQQNQGVSTARNAGMAQARGEYIGFVDADDWMEPNACERMYNTAKTYDCDIVSCDFAFISHDTMRREAKFPFDKGKCMHKDRIYSEILPFFIKSDSFASPCNKIYRLKTIKENKIYFPKDIFIGEDYIFNMLAYHKARTVFHIAEVLYNYRIAHESATNSLSKRLMDNYIRVYVLKDSIIKDWSFINPEKRRELAAQWLINAVLTFVCRQIYHGGISGIIQARQHMNNEFIRERIKELGQSFCYESRFMNYVFHAFSDRSCFRMVMAVFYVKYISPQIARMRGFLNEEKASVCDR